MVPKLDFNLKTPSLRPPLFLKLQAAFLETLLNEYLNPLLTSFFFLSQGFWRWAIFKFCIKFVTILLLFQVLGFVAEVCGDLTCPTRDQTCTPCIGRQSLNHWITREVPCSLLTFFCVVWVSCDPNHSSHRQGPPVCLAEWWPLCSHLTPPLSGIKTVGASISLQTLTVVSASLSSGFPFSPPTFRTTPSQSPWIDLLSSPT